MTKRRKWLLGIVTLGAVGWFVTDLYLTEFWYQKPEFVIGVENLASDTLNNVRLACEPEGRFVVGVLEPTQSKWHMDPRWAFPKAVRVDFMDAAGTDVSLIQSMPEEASGDEIVVQIVERSGQLALVIQLGKRM